MIHVAKAVMTTRVVLLLAVATSLLTAGPRIRLGGIGAGGTYMSGNWGPWWGGMPYWGYWDPYWSGLAPMSWMHRGYVGGFVQGPGMGEVKLANAPEDGVVYLDGAYAGEVKKLKSIWLEPGIYQLEVRKGDSAFSKKIYVLSGKTLQLRAEVRK
jgi:hypothetical protein